jgi:signal transduction histidine kinase
MSSSALLRAFLLLLLAMAMGITVAKEISAAEINTPHASTTAIDPASANNSDNLNQLEPNQIQKGFVIALQLGVAFTLITWAAIRAIHTRQKIYIFFVATLGFATLRMISTQADALTNINLSPEQIYLLSPFLNLGTMINGLYTVHLATTSQGKQTKRKTYFILLYALGITAAILSLFIPRPLLIGMAITLIAPTAGLILYDLIYAIKNDQDKGGVLVIKYLLLGTLVLAFFMNSASFIQASVNGVEGLNRANTGLFSFILCSILFIYMVTFMDQQTSDKNTLDTSNALEAAANESALRQNQQRFLSMLMHEIRTPLSVIKIGADAITKPNHPNEPESIWTQRIDTAIDNIAQVIDNCVQAEKQESGLIQPTIQKHLIKNEIESLHREYLSANAELESRIKFNIDIKSDTCVITDINYVRSIMLNLISNAYKYSEPFSTINIRVLYEHKHTNNKILFQIENSLGKVEPPDADQIFQRYYRSESAKKFAGTGLGLWLSQTLAHQIGSRIEMKITEQQTILFFFSLQATT